MTNTVFFTNNLERDIKSLIDHDIEEYYDPFSTHPHNLLMCVLNKFYPVPTVHDSNIHDRRVRKLTELLNSGNNNIQDAKIELLNIHKEEVMKGIANREVHKKEFLKFAMCMYLEKQLSGAEPALKMRCPHMFTRVMSSPHGVGLLELHTASWIWKYVNNYPLWSSGPGEYVDRPSAVVDLLLKFE
ncbi:hypothetical protein BAU67_001877 [Escherichia coli]|nr:hypothetical protein [Escherichia coli]EMB7054118.1 hypothetical protein [Escherichia coli]